jgi:predicted dehydrogenase
MKPLRIGIVGCGAIAPTHGNVLHRLEQEGLARLVAATDIVRDRAAAFTQKYGGDVVDSFEAMLARNDVDSVTLCTPSGLHGAMAIQAAQAGKHVLSEKPLDIRVEQIDKAIEAAATAGIVYGGIFNTRFAPASQKLKRAIDAGAFGKIVLACAETKWYRSQAYYDSGDWRGTWDLDAGVFCNQGIHGLDKLLWLAGDVEEIISATLEPNLERDIEAETLGVVTVRFKSGALGTITMTTLSYDGFPERVDISGTKGSAILLEGDTLTHFVTQEPFEEADEIDRADAEALAAGSGVAKDPTALSGEGHYSNIRDFVLAVHEKREPIISAPEARKAVNLLNMIYRKAGVGPFK